MNFSNYVDTSGELFRKADCWEGRGEMSVSQSPITASPITREKNNSRKEKYGTRKNCSFPGSSGQFIYPYQALLSPKNDGVTNSQVSSEIDFESGVRL